MAEPTDASPAARCPACDAERIGRFCQECGQDNRYERLRTRDVLSRWTHAVTDADSSLWTTLRELTVSPGRFVRAYVAGKRSGRFPPFRYLLLTTTAWIALMALLVPTLTPPVDESAPDPELARAAAEFVTRFIAAIVIAALPVTALVTRLLWWKSGRNYAECCALLAFLYAHTNVITLPFAPLAHWDYMGWQLALMIVQFLYVTWGLKGFYGGSIVRVTLKSLALTLAYYLCAMVLGSIVAIGYMIWMKSG